jgi:hypothetical protein
MAMTAAVKARLKAAGENRKGRTLKGCDPAKWDNALAKATDKATIQTAVRGGFLRGDPVSASRTIARERDLDCAFSGDNPDAIRWARFRHDSPEHLEAMCEKLPWRLVRVQSCDGKQVTYRDVIVFQAENLVALLLTLFGIGNLRAAAKKYIAGYDDKHANERPGVGQTLVLRQPAGGVLKSGELVRVASVDDERQQYMVQSVLDPMLMAEIRPCALHSTFQWHTGAADIPGTGGTDRKEARTKRIDAIFARFGVEI